MKRFAFIVVMVGWCLSIGAKTVSIPNAQTWTASWLNTYRGQTITFAEDWYVCNNYRDTYTISPRRIFSPTNQALPQSAAYNTILSLNNQGTVTLTGVSGYHRMGERLHNLTVYVSSAYSLQLQSCEWVGNTRQEVEKGINMADLDRRGKHNLLVCATNLQYYLVENVGTGMGPGSQAAHNAQRTKVSQALAKINADIYGVLEVEQGQAAMAELASDLSARTGRHFAYIQDATSPYGSYTKSGYIYCSDVVTPDGSLRLNNTAVVYRKYMQAFRHKATGECFIFSINHFKAKSGTGTGDDADQGDGQGIFNATRTREAQSVISEYHNNKTYYDDDDLLIMGDLNAYAMEDPIQTLVFAGMTDLHRYFHADSSYSYVFHGQAGYLDHALCNATLLPQVTGMSVYHINADEQIDYDYNSSDRTMFRCSDHDPVLVGLCLGQTAQVPSPYITCMARPDAITLRNAEGGHVRIYDIHGQLMTDERVTTAQHDVLTADMPTGLYIIHLYVNGEVIQQKVMME